MNVKIKKGKIKVICTHREAVLLKVGIDTFNNLHITDDVVKSLNYSLFDNQEIKSSKELKKLLEYIYIDLSNVLNKIEVY